MNEYVLHEQLLAMEGILAEYDAAEGLRWQVRQTVERLKSQLYRVAVIGEFKRGKSSLVNAIIGEINTSYNQRMAAKTESGKGKTENSVETGNGEVSPEGSEPSEPSEESGGATGV